MATMEMTTRMRLINKKLALAGSLTAIVVGLATGVAFAQGDTDDSISPANTNFTATQTTGAVFSFTVNGFSVTVTCKNASLSATTPSSGLGPAPINTPSFGNCTDNLGFTDTVATNSTNGNWHLTWVDAPNDESQTEPNSGDQQQITIPKAGVMIKLAFPPGCVITFPPAQPAPITGSSDDMNKLTFSNASILASGSGCAVSSVAMSVTFKFTPGFHDGS